MRTEDRKRNNNIPLVTMYDLKSSLLARLGIKAPPNSVFDMMDTMWWSHSVQFTSITASLLSKIILGTYHTSALKLCDNNVTNKPVIPLRKRGNQKKRVPGPLSRHLRNTRERI